MGGGEESEARVGFYNPNNPKRDHLEKYFFDLFLEKLPSSAHEHLVCEGGAGPTKGTYTKCHSSTYPDGWSMSTYQESSSDASYHADNLTLCKSEPRDGRTSQICFSRWIQGCNYSYLLEYKIDWKKVASAGGAHWVRFFDDDDVMGEMMPLPETKWLWDLEEMWCGIMDEPVGIQIDPGGFSSNYYINTCDLPHMRKSPIPRD